MPRPTVDPGRPPLAIVTGASSGIGREIATELARRGYRTLLIARRAAILEALANELSDFAPSRALPLDLSSPDAIAPALAGAQAELGAASVLINNAGAGIYRSFLDHSPADLSRLMQLNHVAAALCTQAVLPGMLDLARRGGKARIVNICSGAAVVGPWGHASYAASKGAMQAFSQSLAAEFNHLRFPEGGSLRFMLVYPGIVDTPYFRLPDMAPAWPIVKHRAISPERVARAIVKQLDRAPLTIFVPGHYRLLELIAAISPAIALKLVRAGSQARHYAPQL